MAERISGKVVVITGGSSGLGEATARHLAAHGASVVIGARRKERMDEIVKDIRADGGKAEAFVMNVTRRGDVEALVQEAARAFGRVDVMVNNAGLMLLSPLAKLKVEEWDRMIDVNIKGVLYGIAAVLPLMLKQKSGHIINIASVAGHRVSAGGAVYSGTKYAVRAISEGVRLEGKPYIRTTIISPGAVESELPDHISDPDTAKVVKTFYDIAIPADAVAEAIAYAIGQPLEVDINEILLRPTKQER